uniref:Uncharacterized protein n=1 Tax=Rhizophora mucronata TaxID=61149 RepID=A0A2P2NHB9_RHIMU
MEENCVHVKDFNGCMTFVKVLMDVSLPCSYAAHRR